MSHRVLVLSQGRATAELDAAEATAGDGDGRRHHEGMTDGSSQPVIDPAPSPVPWRAAAAAHPLARAHHGGRAAP